MNPSDEIKTKLDIVEVIREYVQLKPAGMGFRAPCPFHKEKTPSFQVSPEKQIWHCFGCNRGGDVFSFVMEMEHISFVEALRLLAPKAGVTLKSVNPRLASERNKLLDIADLARKYYHKILTDAKLAEAARNYLEERGLNEEIIASWQIGYSFDSWDQTTNFLKQKGFSETEIFLAGLSVKKEGTNRFYDRFRGRIMFPLRDVNGDTVGFTARILPAPAGNPQLNAAQEKMGKYINSPQTMIYDKSKILFGLDKARPSIRAEDGVIIVEGQMDAITAHQFGFTNVIASSGTALTADQIKILSRYTNNIIFALDADSAGQNAIDRGEETIKRLDYKVVSSQDHLGKIKSYIDPVLSFNINLKVIEIPEGKDPDECIRKNPEGWTRAAAGAKPIMQYYFDKIFNVLDMKNVEHKRLAAKNLLPKISRLNNKIEQSHWLKKLSQALDVRESELWEELNKMPKINLTAAEADLAENSGKDRAISRKNNREDKLSELLMALILKYPGQLEYVAERIAPEAVSGPDNQLLYKNLIIYYNKVIEIWTQEGSSVEFEFNYQDFKDWLESNLGQNNNLSKINRSSDYFESILETGGESSSYRNFQPVFKRGGEEISNQPAVLTLINNLDKLALLADRDYYDYDQEQIRGIIIGTVRALKKSYLLNRLSQVTKLIDRLERGDGGGNESKMKALLEEFNILTEEIRLIEKD